MNLFYTHDLVLTKQDTDVLLRTYCLSIIQSTGSVKQFFDKRRNTFRLLSHTNEEEGQGGDNVTSWRTDLALEERESFEEDDVEISGVVLRKEAGKTSFTRVTTVEILNEHGARAMRKPKGSYITIEIPELLKEEEQCQEAAAEEIAAWLEHLMKEKKRERILIVGLGNRDITADALGPMVVEEVIVTRHFFREFGSDFGKKHGYRNVCAFAPGVMAQTGMETMEAIRGIVSEVQPDVVLAIDALAAKSVHRLNITIQLTDTGICPGAGIGNNRQALNEESLGCPVIALGVPTVVDAATIVREGIERFANQKKLAQQAEQFLDRTRDAFMDNMFVTPKNIDCSVRYVSETVAEGINRWMKEK